MNDAKKIYARQAEVYAAFSEYSDYETGRLLDAIDDPGELDNTLVIYISDNGTSPEGDQTGNWNWNKYLNGVPETEAGSWLIWMSGADPTPTRTCR